MGMMSKLRRGIVAAVLSLMVFYGIAIAAPAHSIPQLAGLRPFTKQTNYMSLAGYVRYAVYHQTQRWMSFTEAKLTVSHQR